jgi:hypothetical protein
MEKNDQNIQNQIFYQQINIMDELFQTQLRNYEI